MNNELPGNVNRFIAERKEQGDLSAALLYGSYARGTQHAQSDVDLIFVVDKGFKSELVINEGIELEILEATKSNMFSYWKENWDEDRHWYLWKDVKIIYDRDDEGEEILKYALSLVGEREPWPRAQIEKRRHVVRAKIERIEYLSLTDPGTASMLLVEYVREQTENWFKIRGQFVPSTKEFLALFSAECPEFGELLKTFYFNNTDIKARILQVRDMVEIIYG